MGVHGARLSYVLTSQRHREDSAVSEPYTAPVERSARDRCRAPALHPGPACAEPGQGIPPVRWGDEQLPDRSARPSGQRVRRRRRRSAPHWRLHAAVSGRGPARQVEPLDDLLDQPAGRLDGDPVDRRPRDVVRLPQDDQPLLILSFATVAPGTCSALNGPARSGTGSGGTTPEAVGARCEMACGRPPLPKGDPPPARSASASQCEDRGDGRNLSEGLPTLSDMVSFIKSVTFDCQEPLLVAAFWARALGSNVDED